MADERRAGQEGSLPVTTRVVRLPHDRTLTVRAATDDDLVGLEQLYAGLSGDDRYRRFFSGSRPPRSFLKRWTHLPERGGVVLVAETDRPDPGTDGLHLVAEAGYSLLPNGNGELGITVSPHWRGWLGPYLLDMLLTEAAARGVPDLEAEVLIGNRPTHTLLRSRGLVVSEHPDHTTVRVVIGTEGRVPAWPREHGRPRLLVEAPGGHWRGEAAARAAGVEALACPGPAGRPGLGCPVLEGGRCPLADGADALVVAFPEEDGTADEILAAHRAAHPDLPVYLDRHPDHPDDDLADWLAGVELRPDGGAT